MRTDPSKDFINAFEQYADELFRHASLRLPDHERALELVQDSFVRAWEYVVKGEEVREYRAFLYRILKNLIIDEYRKHKTTSLESMMEAEDGSLLEARIPQDETNTLESAMERLDGAAALATVAELPEVYREVLLLRYVDGLSPKEIAVRLEVSENVVSVRLHRGLKKLHDKLTEEGDMR